MLRRRMLAASITAGLVLAAGAASAVAQEAAAFGAGRDRVCNTLADRN